jgi:hypothetical protein
MLSVVPNQNESEVVTYLDDKSLNVLKVLKTKADNNRAVGEKSYEYIPTEDVVQSVGDYLTELGHDFSVKIVTGAAAKSSKHIAEFTLDSVALFPGEGKDGGPGGHGKILVVNSYNAESSLLVMAGAIRFCCANGIISGTHEFFEKVVHRQGEVCNQKLMQLNDKIKIACEYLENNFGAVVNKMTKTEVKFTKECEIVLGLDIPNQAKLMVIEKIHPTNRANLRKEDQPKNLWTLFNVINECIKECARHEMSNFEYNTSLMDDVIRLAA